ncbi:TPA: GNAT family N-acetyltransferase [Candidatus Bathyarchaeota archaeon]|nr:GNAT family N-acetyltransferase [Candidatus Bathyarchaeota archaeon]
MSVVRLVEGEEFEEYTRQSLDAYPVMMETVTPEQRKGWIERMKKAQAEGAPTHSYGVFRGDKMVGGARYHDFEMNVHGTIVKAGGVANVFVDLLHKKEHVAKDLMEHFHAHYRDEGAPLAALYPFRPDFYRHMGYGYGRKLNQYRIKPGDLPRGDKTGVDFLTPADAAEATGCYNRYARATHGMVIKPEANIARLIQRNKVIGYRRDGRIEALAKIHFDKVRPDNPLLQNITVNYLVYENPEAFRAIVAFLGSQLDQVDRIVFETHDDDLHFLPSDPRDGEQAMFYTCWEANRQAVGIMYRVLDTRRLFEALSGHDFNGESMRLRLTLRDNFFPENDSSTLIQFKGGEAKVLDRGRHDAEVKMGVEWFSSLIMGVVDFRPLHTYGQAHVTDASYVATLDRLFHSHEKPVTMEEF